LCENNTENQEMIYKLKPEGKADTIKLLNDLAGSSSGGGTSNPDKGQIKGRSPAKADNKNGPLNKVAKR